MGLLHAFLVHTIVLCRLFEQLESKPFIRALFTILSPHYQFYPIFLSFSLVHLTATSTEMYWQTVLATLVFLVFALVQGESVFNLHTYSYIMKFDERK